MKRTHIAALLLVGTALAACSASSATENASEGVATELAPNTDVTIPTPTTEEATTTTTVEPATTSKPEVDYSAAEETLDAWAAAITAGDVTAALATHTHAPEDAASESEAQGFLALTISHAEFNDCEFSTLPTNRRVEAVCDLTLIDPMLVATGMETVQVRWLLSADGTAILASEPGYRLSPRSQFVSYAIEHYPWEFAESCGPGTPHYNALVGWGFTHACGRFAADIADEVAAAIYEATYPAAQRTLDDWAEAIAADDVDAALATHEFDSSDLASERESMGYLAAIVSEAEFNDCQFSAVSANGHILAECDLTLMDPILSATGLETVPVTWRLSNDGTAILFSEPGFRLSSEDIFVSYVKAQYPHEFAAACGPSTVNFNSFTGWAFNRACGEFTADIADEAVEAFNAAG